MASGFLKRYCFIGTVSPTLLFLAAAHPAHALQPSSDDLAAVRAVEESRIAAIEQVIGSVIAIYGDDREGGGSGVIIDPSGLALTNHHVIQAAGVEGWGGLADGNLYRWSIIGTDPGGDIALIQMYGDQPFPYARLADSDQVRVGDWALAMGNPFVLSEDESPTVTLGIVSGINRFQEGAGSNQLVYGNCIQFDSSINPGNSGGPLFNLRGEIIGINGRGSFEARGRVNVGLGYAISANQIKNFIPELLATKVVEHGTVDAVFDWRDGRVVCASLVEGSELNRSGLELGDRLVEFEGHPIRSVNQYLNLICTLPEGWPVELVIEKSDGSQKQLNIDLFGLPYNIEPPKLPETPKEGEPQPTPEQKKVIERQQKMIELLASEPGAIRDRERNARSTEWLLDVWRHETPSREQLPAAIRWVDSVESDGQPVGRQEVILASDGRFRVDWQSGDQATSFGFDGSEFWQLQDGAARKLTLVEAKMTPQIIQVLTIAAGWGVRPFQPFGSMHLDGSDKAQDQLACRLKIVDPRDDWFYCWTSLFADSGEWLVRPLQVSSERFPHRRSGKVTFAEWGDLAGIPFPTARAFVRPADTEPEICLRLTDGDRLEVADDSEFAVPSGEGPGVP